MNVTTRIKCIGLSHEIQIRPLTSLFIGALLGGFYMSLGTAMMFITSEYAAEEWVTLSMAVAYSVGTLLVVIAGADLIQHHIMFHSMALLDRIPSNLTGAEKTSDPKVHDLIMPVFILILGGVVGAIVSSLVLFIISPVLAQPLDTISQVSIAKSTAMDSIVFLRATVCGWVLCMIAWGSMRTDLTAKIIFVIIFSAVFVLLGFEEYITNLTIAVLTYLGDVTSPPLLDTIFKLLITFAGNIVGAMIFAFLYYLLPVPKKL